MIGIGCGRFGACVLSCSALFGLLAVGVMPSVRGDRTLQEERGQTRPSVEASRRVEKEVRAFLTHYLETLEKGDERAVASLFVSDGRFAWYTDGAKSYSSPQDVVEGKRRYAGVSFRTNLSKVVVVSLGTSRASVRSAFRTRLEFPDGRTHEYGGVITWLVEKDAKTETWRVILGHTSTPSGPPGAGRSDPRQEKKTGKEEPKSRSKSAP